MQGRGTRSKERSIRLPRRARAGLYVEGRRAVFHLVVVNVEHRGKIAALCRANVPLLVAEEDGKVLGYASLSPYRDFDAYLQTEESRKKFRIFRCFFRARFAQPTRSS